MRLFGAFVLSQAALAALVGLVSAEDCCKIGRRLFDGSSLKTEKGRPFCTINGYLCRTSDQTDLEASLRVLNELFGKWGARHPWTANVEATFEILRSLAAFGSLRRDNHLCSVRSLEIIVNELPDYERHYGHADPLADSRRLGHLFQQIADEYAAECPEAYLERFQFYRRTFNKTFMGHLLATIDRIIEGQLGVFGGAPKGYTKLDYMRSGRLVQFGGQAAAELLIDGLRSVGDGATVEHLQPPTMAGRQSAANKQAPPATGPSQLVSYGTVHGIIRRYVVKPCAYFINHFKAVFPILRQADFQAFGRLLEPRGDHQSDYYHYWIIYDACRAFNYELQSYFNKITKSVVAEFNGYGNFQDTMAN